MTIADSVLNRWHKRGWCICCVAAVVCLASSGCGTGSSTANNPAAEQMARQVLAADLPEGVTSLADSYANFSEGQNVVVAGRIFASIASPFAEDTASFNVIELPKPGHDHETPGDCPFCKREMENAATAIVEIVDEDGAVIAGSAERLLGLKKNQDVVVVGTASMVGEIMVIRARSLHVLSEERATEFAKSFST